jgi:hypothetical protein
VTAPALTARQLNRALLARQLLLERVALPIPVALERIGGIQNQYAPNAYIRLWSMLEGFRRDDLTRAYERAEVVQGTLLRGTIHAVSAGDYRPSVAAVRAPTREWASRIYRDDGADRDAVVARVRRALAGRTVTRPELLGLLDGATRSAAATIHTDAEILRVPPQGTWERRRAHLFGLASDRLGAGEGPPEDEAIEHLVRRYLGGFGPAAVRDIQAFTGLPAARLKPVLARLPLVRFRDAAGKELLDLPDQPLPDADTPAPVRFLPTWDATLLVHARRTGILDEAYRKIIFSSKVPPSFPTILVDPPIGWPSSAITRPEITPSRLGFFSCAAPVQEAGTKRRAASVNDNIFTISPPDFSCSGRAAP